MFESTIKQSLLKEGFSWSLFRLVALVLALIVAFQLLAEGLDAWKVSKLSVGDPQDDVRRILGPPDSEWDGTESTPRAQASPRKTLVYLRWFRDDILVELDEKGNVVSIERAMVLQFVDT